MSAQPPYDAPADRPSRSRSGLVIGAIATAVAVTAGVGAYAAMQLRGGGRQPETVAPATAFAFAKVDLDPSARQKLVVRELMRKFPDAPQGELDEVFDEFLRTALQGDDDVDFDRDVDPWLGDRIGVAGFTGPSGRPSVLGIIRSKDDGAAVPALQRLAAADDSAAAYLLRDGYVLVGPDQASLDFAVAGIADGTLADHDEYADDVAALDGDQIVTAWADLTKAYEAAAEDLGADPEDVPEILADRLTGRFALGVHAERDYIEMEGVTTGVDTGSLTGSPATLLADLPGSTVAAVSAVDVGRQLEESLDAFGAFPGLPTRADLTASVQESFGLDLSADLLPLLGDQTVLSLGDVPDFESDEAPDVALLSLVADPARAGKVASKIQDLATQQGAPLRARVVGNTFLVATGDSYLDALSAGGSRLAERPRFRRAVGDLDDEVAFVAYADLRELLTLAKDSDRYDDLRAIAAVGVRAGVRDGRGYLRVRVVVE
ncbi:MAG TPA: DUF3352 domain-containing protein [Mycobacteriales bacterium]|nr:DUF3352 domain-containing protein [Mycobacteriales bacterium]